MYIFSIFAHVIYYFSWMLAELVKFKLGCMLSQTGRMQKIHRVLQQGMFWRSVVSIHMFRI